MPEEHQEQNSGELENEPRLDELLSLSEAAKQTEISTQPAICVCSFDAMRCGV